jgi:hypothetical protein
MHIHTYKHTYIHTHTDAPSRTHWKQGSAVWRVGWSSHAGIKYNICGMYISYVCARLCTDMYVCIYACMYGLWREGCIYTHSHTHTYITYPQGPTADPDALESVAEHFWKAGEAHVREVKPCLCVPLCIYVFSLCMYVYVGVWWTFLESGRGLCTWGKSLLMCPSMYICVFCVYICICWCVAWTLFKSGRGLCTWGKSLFMLPSVYKGLFCVYVCICWCVYVCVCEHFPNGGDGCVCVCMYVYIYIYIYI